MNSRERLSRCYFNIETDRPAVYSRQGYPVDDPTYDRLKEYLNTFSDLKYGWNGRCFEKNYYCEYRTESYSDNFQRNVTILHTPAGDLSSSSLGSLKGQPGMQETYFIKARKDAEMYLTLPLPELEGNAFSFFAAEKEIGDCGITEVNLGLNPAGFVVELCGSELFAIMSMEDRDILHQLCDRQMKIILRTVKHLLNLKIGPFFSLEGEEYLVPPMHGPDDFYEFNVRYDKPIIDLIHEAKGGVHIHCHGAVKKVLKSFIEMGVDVLHPFESPPMGDIDIACAKKNVRDKICIEGNIQIASMYEHKPEQIREETWQIIKDGFEDGKGLIVSPTASPYIRGKGEKCFEQYRAMVETVINWTDK